MTVLGRYIQSIQTRFIIAVMIFFSLFFSHILRGNMSIAITSMAKKEESPIEMLPDYGPRYKWSSYEEGLMLGSYFYGYLISSFPGGYLAEIIGGRRLVGYSSAICAILTTATPIVAPIFWLSFACRFAVGLFGGFVFPVGQSFIAKWAPPNEKSKFISTFGGGFFGTVVSWPICGIIIETIGWPSVFYVTGAVSLAFTGVWFSLAYDSPAKHPRISQKEKDYIESKVVGVSKSAKLVPPYVKMLKSIPFWSLLILHFGNMWGIFFVLTATPKFMNEVMGFKIETTGILSMLPNLSRWIMMTVFGFVGIFLIALNYVNTKPYWCVAFMTISTAFNGASVLTSMQNSHDLAPNYTATISGIINGVGTAPGFISPLIVAYFTQDNNTVKEWEMVFIIGGIVYIVPAIIFMIFGSGKRQSWNEPDSA